MTRPFDRIPRVRVTDPETSKAAAKAVKETQCMSMLRAFATYPRWGLTDEEAADFCDLDTGMSCWWHRASDLRSMGYIEWLYDNDGVLVKRLGKAGRYRGVSRITASGMARAKREGLYDT